MKTKIIAASLLVGVFCFTMFSCDSYHRVKGNENPVVENRSISGFDQVNASSDFQVEIYYDSIFNVAVNAEENLIHYIKTDVSGNVLHIGVKNHCNLDPNYPIIVRVYLPVLTATHLSGSGSISVDTFNVEQLDADISGSGNISIISYTHRITASVSGSGEFNLSGTSDEADFDISGSGDIRSLNLMTKNCSAKISGSGNIYTSVSDLLDVNISGSGDVYYSGSPVIDISISGSGSVVHY
jgi:hypothetical protein